ncbi:Lrp/AsnC family transcriptional regulator [Pseudactinotalea sp. Z1732]|uniref:Lrp/AsnC family transcriptional regulator n=1 Tax=Micrococcales TaxID=85006 RepID=UPI003C7E6151
MSADGGYGLDLDRRLVRALQQNPRASVVALAHAIHEPRAVVGQRLRALIDSGAIRVVAAVHPHFAGLQVTAHVSVATRGPVADAATLVASWPQTVLVSIVAGAHDLIMEVRVPTHTDIQALLAQVRRHPAVVRTSTVIYTGVFKGLLEHDTYEPMSIDATDRALLRELQRDGRANWQDLAVRVARSSSAVRVRVNRMLQAGIARLVVVQERGHFGRLLTMGVGLTLRSEATQVLTRLRHEEDVEFAAATIGRFDAVVTLRGASPVDLDASLERLRSFPEVTALEAWAHLRSVKEDYTSAL